MYPHLMVPRITRIAWNYIELSTLFTLSESLADGEIELQTIGSMRKLLTTALA